jgi:hypothetical protein
MEYYPRPYNTVTPGQDFFRHYNERVRTNPPLAEPQHIKTLIHCYFS